MTTRRELSRGNIGKEEEEEEEEQVVAVLFPQGYLQARHIRSSIHNTVKRNKDGGSTHHQVLLLLLLSIPLTIIKEKEELLLLSQLTFFNMLTVLVLLNCTEYNSLRDSTGLADGRRRVQMVHTTHTHSSSRQLADEYTTPLQRSNKIKKKKQHPGIKEEEKFGLFHHIFVKFQDMYVRDRCCFSLSQLGGKTYNISAQDYIFEEHVYIVCCEQQTDGSAPPFTFSYPFCADSL